MPVRTFAPPAHWAEEWAVLGWKVADGMACPRGTSAPLLLHTSFLFFMLATAPLVAFASLSSDLSETRTHRTCVFLCQCDSSPLPPSAKSRPSSSSVTSCPCGCSQCGPNWLITLELRPPTFLGFPPPELLSPSADFFLFLCGSLSRFLFLSLLFTHTYSRFSDLL